MHYNFDEIDAFLVERIALYMVRLQRTPWHEAELVTSLLHPPVYGEDLKFSLDELRLIDPGQPARIGSLIRHVLGMRKVCLSLGR